MKPEYSEAEEATLLLKFTPLEFETVCIATGNAVDSMLKFTPLEFETIA